MNKALSTLSALLKETHIDLSFKIIEVGALKIQNKEEPFY